MRQPFYVFPRKMSKGIRFYIQFSNPNRSGRSVTVSATTLKEQLGYSTFHPVKSKYEAFSIGKEAFEKGIFFNQQAEVLFADYVMNFWDFDNSDYIKRRNKEKPNSITKAYANQERNRFLTYAMPLLPPNLKLVNIRSSDCEKLRDNLFKQNKSNSTINKVLQSLRSPLKEAYRLSLISDNIAEKIENASISSEEKGMPTPGEVSRLLSYLVRKNKPTTYGRINYLMVALAVTTGMRQGEIQALKPEDFTFVNDTAIIRISHSYSPTDGYKCTKGKKTRASSTDARLAKEILEFAQHNPHDNGFCFWSPSVSDKPVGKRYIIEHFQEALEAIGISQEEQKSRNLTFHSLRGFFATLMLPQVGAETTKKVVGHQNIATTERFYIHENETELVALNETRKNLISLPSTTNQ
ncbi:MAG: site-specific integrase [Sphaerochaetaceae bacterium]|nr:site-specific integrase [Sphaerochaetaceae bacterium]